MLGGGCLSSEGAGERAARATWEHFLLLLLLLLLGSWAASPEVVGGLLVFYFLFFLEAEEIETLSITAAHCSHSPGLCGCVLSAPPLVPLMSCTLQLVSTMPPSSLMS